MCGEKRLFQILLSIRFLFLIAVDCGLLPAPGNGDVVHTGTTFNEMAEFSCNTGYELSHSSSRRCMADATWSGSSPTCIRMYTHTPVTNVTWLHHIHILMNIPNHFFAYMIAEKGILRTVKF